MSASIYLLPLKGLVAGTHRPLQQSYEGRIGKACLYGNFD